MTVWFHFFISIIVFFIKLWRHPVCCFWQVPMRSVSLVFQHFWTYFAAFTTAKCLLVCSFWRHKFVWEKLENSQKSLCILVHLFKDSGLELKTRKLTSYKPILRDFVKNFQKFSEQICKKNLSYRWRWLSWLISRTVIVETLITCSLALVKSDFRFVLVVVQIRLLRY